MKHIQHRKRHKSRTNMKQNILFSVLSIFPVLSSASTNLISNNNNNFQIKVKVQKINYFVKETLEVTCYDIPKSKLNSLTITQRIINSDESENLVERNQLRPRYKDDDWYLNQDPSKTSVRIEKRNLAMEAAFFITCELTDCKGGDRCRADSDVIHIRSK